MNRPNGKQLMWPCLGTILLVAGMLTLTEEENMHVKNSLYSLLAPVWSVVVHPPKATVWKSLRHSTTLLLPIQQYYQGCD